MSLSFLRSADCTAAAARAYHSRRTHCTTAVITSPREGTDSSIGKERGENLSVFQHDNALAVRLYQGITLIKIYVLQFVLHRFAKVQDAAQLLLP